MSKTALHISRSTETGRTPLRLRRWRAAVQRSLLSLLSSLFVMAVLGSANAVAAGLNLQPTLNARVVANNGYGGGIMFVQQGQDILWQGSSGNWGYETSPIWIRNTFEIASITKTFTATVILQMHEDKNSPVKLWKTLGQLLPPSVVNGLLVVGGHDYGPEIHVRELLKHTSGLPDYWESQAFNRAFEADEDRFWFPEELIEYVKDMKPIGKPPARWNYADTNYVLLGMIIEQATGQPLEQVFREQIFDPLGMTETYLSYRELPTSWRRESHRFEYREDLYRKPRQSADWAGGGLVSNVEDLQKFMRALFQGRLFVDASTLDAMKRWQNTGIPGVTYGFGLFRIDLGPALGELWGHDGWGNSFMYYWPQRDIGFTGTLNQVDNDWWPMVEDAIDQITWSN